MTTTVLWSPCGCRGCHRPWPPLTTVRRAKPPIWRSFDGAGLRQLTRAELVIVCVAAASIWWCRGVAFGSSLRRAGLPPARSCPAPLRTYPPRQPAEAASRPQAHPVDPLGQDMVQACGRAPPGRDISWPQRGDTYFPHLLGEPDRIPAGAHLERERADRPGAAGRHPADADGVVIPAGLKVPAPHPPLIASGVPERHVLASR